MDNSGGERMADQTSMGSPYNEYQAKALLGEYTESVPCSSCILTGGLASTRECF